VIVIGGSTGALPVLEQIARDLPPDLPVAVFVVLHLHPEHRSHLPAILSRAGPLPAAAARSGEPVQPGRIYVAPPDYHLLLRDERVYLDRSPRENGFRPAIDPLFRTAARAYGPQTVGILLSGGMADGVVGLMAIKLQGGTAIVQDPSEAKAPSMPAAALRYVKVDYTLAAAAIAPTLVQLCTAARAEEMPMAMLGSEEPDARIVQEDFDEQVQGERDGETTVITCPECGGTLWQLREGEFVHFRCHVGHRYGSDTLLREQAEALERALWTCVRMLQEKVLLSRQLGHRARAEGRPRIAARFEENATADEEGMTILRQFIASAALGSAAPADEAVETEAGDDD